MLMKIKTSISSRLTNNQIDQEFIFAPASLSKQEDLWPTVWESKCSWAACEHQYNSILRTDQDCDFVAHAKPGCVIYMLSGYQPTHRYALEQVNCS